MFSWYSCDKQVASFPLPGPGAFTKISFFVVSMYGLAPYPSSLTIVSISVGYPLVNVWIYVFIPFLFNFLINLSAPIWFLYRVITTELTLNPNFLDVFIIFISSLS